MPAVLGFQTKTLEEVRCSQNKGCLTHRVHPASVLLPRHYMFMVRKLKQQPTDRCSLDLFDMFGWALLVVACSSGEKSDIIA